MNTTFDVRKTLDPTLRRLDRLPAEERAKAVAGMWSQLAEVQTDLARIRRIAIRGMRETMTLEEVGRRLGLSLSRVKQLLEGRAEHVEQGT